MHIDEINKAEIPLGPDWQLTYHQLYYLSPDLADEVEGCPAGFSIWHAHFSEDLLQMKNPRKGQLLDVGWYPHADPSGSFGLLLIPYDPSFHGEEDEAYHWKSPLIDYQTRCIDSLLEKIASIVR